MTPQAYKFMGLLSIWYLFFLAGTFQTRYLKRLTKQMVLDYAEKWREKEVQGSYAELYEALLDDWKNSMANRVPFILHKYELWPVKCSLENVENKIPLSPSWIQKYLVKEGFLYFEEVAD